MADSNPEADREFENPPESSITNIEGGHRDVNTTTDYYASSMMAEAKMEGGAQIVVKKAGMITEAPRG